jgi:hypothetical protein
VTDVISTGNSVRPAGFNAATRLRLLIFSGIAAFIVGGPVAEQFFGVRTPALRSWTMFSGIGLGIIDVSFATRQPDGSLHPLDRFEVLGVRRGGKLKRIESEEELDTVVRELCALLGPGTDLRVTARQGRRSGWQTIRTDATNACAI